MKFKRQLSDMQISHDFPHLRKMQEEIEAQGARVLIGVCTDVEIEASDIKPSGEGRCSTCHRPVVQVSWHGYPDDMEFTGLACRHCHEILEYIGVGPFNWDLLK